MVKLSILTLPMLAATALFTHLWQYVMSCMLVGESCKLAICEQPGKLRMQSESAVIPTR